MAVPQTLQSCGRSRAHAWISNHHKAVSERFGTICFDLQAIAASNTNCSATGTVESSSVGVCTLLLPAHADSHDACGLTMTVVLFRF